MKLMFIRVKFYKKNLLNKSIIAYPNPADNYILIKNPLETDESEILTVFDVNGRKVLEQNIIGNNSEINLNIDNLNSGVYFYKIKNKTNKFIKK